MFITADTKTCSKCEKNKNITEFHKNKRNKKDGLCAQCKKCRNKYNKQYYYNNQNEIKDKHKQYRSNHKDQIQKYQFENSETIKKYKKQYRLDNIDKIKEQHKQYYINNRDELKEQNKQYRIYRRNTDPVWTLKNNISRGLLRILEKIDISKNNNSTLNFLNISMCDLEKLYLSCLNKPCERCNNTIIIDNPKNYEIDHIIPISLAKTEEEVIRLNQLDNLRLICKDCNQEKRDTIENPELLEKFYKNRNKQNK